MCLFAKIFSWSVACLLIFFTLTFTEQIFLILMKSGLSFVYFVDCALVLCQNISTSITYGYMDIVQAPPYQRSFRFSLTLSFRSFIVSRTFRSMIHFELIFEKGVRCVSEFIVLHADVELFQQYLLKELSLLHFIAIVLL